jgi:hypothetical protein
MKRTSNNSYRQSGRSTGVKQLAHAVAISPHEMRRWLRRNYKRHGQLWLFDEREARRVAAKCWEDRR